MQRVEANIAGSSVARQSGSPPGQATVTLSLWDSRPAFFYSLLGVRSPRNWINKGSSAEGAKEISGRCATFWRVAGERLQAKSRFQR
jgi:hypothetical protein